MSFYRGGSNDARLKASIVQHFGADLWGWNLDVLIKGILKDNDAFGSIFHQSRQLKDRRRKPPEIVRMYVIVVSLRGITRMIVNAV